MKKILFITLIMFIFSDLSSQEYMIVTTVESIVPMGIGRSRMIVQKEEINVDDFTTTRTDGKKSDQKKKKPSEPAEAKPTT